MIGQILSNTPLWVWGLLAGLLVLGWSQTRSRSAGLTRITLLPLGLGAFSLYGTVSAFGAAPMVLGSWLAASALLLLIVIQLPHPTGVRYDAANRLFQLPGSWVPMALIMGIFLTKYVVGVSLVLHPELKLATGFSLARASVYGVFSGICAGRALRLVLVALWPAAVSSLPVLHA